MSNSDSADAQLSKTHYCTCERLCDRGKYVDAKTFLRHAGEREKDDDKQTREWENRFGSSSSSARLPSWAPSQNKSPPPRFQDIDQEMGPPLVDPELGEFGRRVPSPDPGEFGRGSPALGPFGPGRHSPWQPGEEAEEDEDEDEEGGHDFQPPGGQPGAAGIASPTSWRYDNLPRSSVERVSIMQDIIESIKTGQLEDDIKDPHQQKLASI
ncbi:hypothetical protein BDN72DRAFT_883770 [Pluteus cervinus]|uniref:Uncharacterized protein n=1 Tax=Pluteus cervinus TaxID=181527 RepID=A0ACD3A407_9AGAR|nr:hypothetical protein BDN72DRAFT_883770 [Pluteus cervinus]